jgi:hypothetical protein
MVTFRLSNVTTGHLLTWTDPGLTGQFTLLIDTGAKSCFARRDSLGLSIAQAIGYGPYVSVTTSVAHGLSSGDSVEIGGSGSFDGVYHDIRVTTVNHFEAHLYGHAYSGSDSVTAGTVYPLTSVRSDLFTTDRANWFLLAEGDNELTVFQQVSGTPTRDYQVQFRWYHHYK